MKKKKQKEVSRLRGNLFATGGVIETNKKIIWRDVEPVGSKVIAHRGEIPSQTSLDARG